MNVLLSDRVNGCKEGAAVQAVDGRSPAAAAAAAAAAAHRTSHSAQANQRTAVEIQPDLENSIHRIFS